MLFGRRFLPALLLPCLLLRCLLLPALLLLRHSASLLTSACLAPYETRCPDEMTETGHRCRRRVVLAGRNRQREVPWTVVQQRPALDERPKPPGYCFFARGRV